MGFKLAQATPTKPPLKDRIAELRAEIDALIDELAEKDMGCGLPLQWLRNDLTKLAPSCQCSQYLIHEEKLK
jgi:hypothetical protein